MDAVNCYCRTVVQYFTVYNISTNICMYVNKYANIAKTNFENLKNNCKSF